LEQQRNNFAKEPNKLKNISNNNSQIDDSDDLDDSDDSASSMELHNVGGS
jgi:hypothetical protein